MPWSVVRASDVLHTTYYLPRLEPLLDKAAAPPPVKALFKVSRRDAALLLALWPSGAEPPLDA